MALYPMKKTCFPLSCRCCDHYIMDNVKSGVGVATASLSLGNTFNSGVKVLKKDAKGVMDKAKNAGNKLIGIFQ